jgi:hypothetical protein
MTQFNIYFKDLTAEAQEALEDIFGTNEKAENWDLVPVAVIEREDEEP